MNESKETRRSRLLLKLVNELGFTASEVHRLIRIESTLSRWSVAECNGEIQRDGEDGDGKPFRVTSYMGDHSGSHFIPDRERGALKQLDAIMAAHPDLWCYNQGDPRGCALYVGHIADLPKMTRAEIARMEGENAAKTPASRLRAVIRLHYTRGVAVCV